MRPILDHLLTAIMIVLIFLSSAYAELVSFKREYKYQASEADSKLTSRTISLEEIKRILLEEIGTYLISETEVKNFDITKDEVKTFTAGIVQTKILSEQWDGSTYVINAELSVDPSEVKNLIEKYGEDQDLKKELEESRKESAEAMAEIELLKAELARVKGLPDNKDKMMKDYKTAVDKFRTNEYLEKGVALNTYKRFEEAIPFFDKVIENMPGSAKAHLGRGVAYYMSGNREKALIDINKAIELKPGYAKAYMHRGILYRLKDDYGNSEQDLNMAIKLGPDLGKAYFQRSVLYKKMGRVRESRDDMKKAAKMGDPKALSIIGKKSWR
ncbi:MAG: tetratricopeptide repeat protein [Nitrospirota bacterium]|nr:MAG: tetratricopeptide repeat protein [Nitrospirota bacterium]